MFIVIAIAVFVVVALARVCRRFPAGRTQLQGPPAARTALHRAEDWGARAQPGTGPAARRSTEQNPGARQPAAPVFQHLEPPNPARAGRCKEPRRQRPAPVPAQRRRAGADGPAVQPLSRNLPGWACSSAPFFPTRTPTTRGPSASRNSKNSFPRRSTPWPAPFAPVTPSPLPWS